MKPDWCQTCVYKDRPGPVEPDGNPETALFLVIGEGPGKDEIEEHKGFMGAAGQELWRLMRAAGIERNQCRVTNVVRCLPHGAAHGDYTLDPRAITHCRKFLDEELKNCQAKRIAVGGKALEALTGEAGIMRWRGVEMESY